MRRWHVLIEPTVPILLLACIVHAVRQNLFDLLLFGGTAVLIVVDSQVAFDRSSAVTPETSGAGFAYERRHGRRWWRRGGWWQAAAVVIGALAFALFTRDSTGIRVVLYVAAGCALGVVAVSARRGDRARTRQPHSPRGWQVWAVIGVIACLWELTSFSFQQADPTKNSAHPISDTTHPAASDLIGPLLTGWPGRVVFLLLWGAAGVWLLRRIRHGPASMPHDDAADGSAYDAPDNAAGDTQVSR